MTPKGDVTACFEVCGDENPLKETFFYGRFDPVASQFKIDMAKLADLRNMTVHNKPKCARCFAKWSCAGDCLIKGDKTHLSQDGEDLRCRMIQEITKAMLVEFTEAGVRVPTGRTSFSSPLKISTSFMRPFTASQAC